MKVLVTNDDGVASGGLHALARALADTGHDVVVVAPDREMSGSSAAIGQIHVDESIDATRVRLPRLDDVPCYAVAGPPGLCVLAAHLGGFGDPPDLVVSGVNPGCNTGRAVLHSGTVGAALTGAGFGTRAMAVSIDVSTLLLHESGGARRAGGGRSSDRRPAGNDRSGSERPEPGDAVVSTRDGEEAVAEVVGDAEAQVRGARADRFDRPALWDTAAHVAVSFVDWLVAAPERTVLNVNVPNRPVDELAGVRLGRLAPFGTVRSSVVQSASEGGGHLQLELRPTDLELPEDSDTALVAQGYVAVTPLTGIRLDETVDVAPLLAAPTAGAGRTA